MIVNTESFPPRIEAIEARIRRSLEREGYHNMNITYVDEGLVRVTGEIATKQDRVIVYNIARTVAEVKHVKVNPD